MFLQNTSCATHITSLINRGQNRQAITLFSHLHSTGLGLTRHLLSLFVKACARVEAITEAKQAHSLIFKNGFYSNIVMVTSLLDAYWRSGFIQQARQLFDEMHYRDIVSTNSMISGFCYCRLPFDAIGLFDSTSTRDVVSWNSLISGLAQNSEPKMALTYFEKMRLEGVNVDVVTMVSVLSICSDMAALFDGKRIHGLVIKFGFESHLPIGNATIDMYAKCGCMDSAYNFFKNMSMKNVISWTALIVGYGKHGLGIEAMKTFSQMEIEEIKPNKITFLGTLYACSHAGLVQEGKNNFDKMVNKYSIIPLMEHYTSMVDLLARAGHLNEAYNFIQEMPINPDSKLLTALLSSCFSHKNLNLSALIARKLLELQPEEAGAYMLLSNFYGTMGNSENVAKVRRLMLNKGIKKEKAYTSIEIDRRFHRFESGDKSHPLSDLIYGYLKNLVTKMKKLGYVPKTSMVMQNVDECLKEEIVLGHSEKLAIVFGLISSPPMTRIMIVKNLRVCVDCHEATGLISRIEGREIVARDSSRFHRFKDGVCSCGNHW